MKYYLSVVIPAYNEVKNIESGVLNEVFNYLSRQKYSWEVILVDDGSPDNTSKLLSSFAKKHNQRLASSAGRNFKFFEEPHRGKAGTVIAGILKAQGEVVLFTDMDQATPLNQIEKFLPKFRDGYDVVIGSRVGREGYPLIRKIMAYGFMTLRKVILNLPYKDTQCGFKAFKKEDSGEIFKRMKVFNDKQSLASGTGKQRAKGAAVTAGFDLEILYIARKLRLKVAEVQVEWHEKGLRKEVNPIKDSWDGFRDLIKVRVNALSGRYQV